VAELVVEASLRHGTLGGAAEIEVVHVGDDDPVRPPGAGRVAGIEAPYLIFNCTKRGRGVTTTLFDHRLKSTTWHSPTSQVSTKGVNDPSGVV
jgi:hypothetical protein